MEEGTQGEEVDNSLINCLPFQSPAPTRDAASCPSGDLPEGSGHWGICVGGV